MKGRQLLAGCGLALLSLGVAGLADAQQVSAALAKPLKAMQDALNAKQWSEVIAKGQEANAKAGKTDYDQFVINSWLYQAHVSTNNLTAAAQMLETTVASPYFPAANRAAGYKGLMSIYYQYKNYPGCVEAGTNARSAGDGSEDVSLGIYQCHYAQQKYKDASNFLQGYIGGAEQAGRRPSEKSLKAQWDVAANRLKDDATANRTVEKLIRYYPKPDYWKYAVQPLVQGKGNDDRLALHIYRLMDAVGVVSRGSDYRDMAQIALDQGNPGEALAVMERAFAKNLFADAEKDSNKRLLEMARTRATNDKAALAQDEKDAAKAATGDDAVAVAAAYLGFGQTDKALALVNSGVAKGQLKYADEAYLLQGIANLRSGKSSEAIKAFNMVKTDPRYTRIAKLWVLHAG